MALTVKQKCSDHPEAPGRWLVWCTGEHSSTQAYKPATAAMVFGIALVAIALHVIAIQAGLLLPFHLYELPMCPFAACRQNEPRTIFVSPAAPCEMKAALRDSQTWDKTAFDVKALIGKTQVVWVYDAVCKLSGVVCALKCYRKETQSRINYQ